MATKRREGESLDSMLRRFNRSVNDAGTLHAIKEHEFYKSPSQKRREKSQNARRKRQKAARLQQARYRNNSED